MACFMMSACKGDVEAFQGKNEMPHESVLAADTHESDFEFLSEVGALVSS